ncbi:MAG: hypothetical protein ACLRVQ_01420 [Lachnospiraceae bacterium]
MKTIKGTILKIVVFLLIFISVAALYFTLNHKEPSLPEENLDTATLPVITMHYDGLEFNALHGYTSPMEAQYMRDVITPLSSDRQLSISIYRYDNNIVGISYEVRSLDTSRLIEDVSLEEWQVNDSDVTAVLDISTIPEKDEEYLLIIKLTTEKHGNIYYYSRIMEQSESEISAQLDFVNNFSLSTLDSAAFESYIGNLEISPSRDNTNLADVDIHSSFNNLTWGNLNVERVSQPVVSITEISGDTSCFQLKYKVRAKNDYDTYQYYNVTEFFRVRLGINTTYLYVYDRNVEQIFDPTEQNISKTRINLGLDSDLTVKYKTNSSGSFVSFVKDGSLWTMDMAENRIISIFSFEDMADGDVRMEYDQFDIEIISTDDNGDTLFLVYGYMEKGAHEGQVGVALYKYYYDNNSVTELVFVPSSKPYNILKDSVGKFAYLTEDNLLYFMIGDSIYTVTMDSNEYVQLVTDLRPGNYIINENNNILAWHENTTIYGADSIRVIDVDAKKDFTIKAGEGEYIKAIGFIENDLIYGTARISDVYTDASGNTIFPMYKIDVLLHTSDSNQEQTTETYAKDNVYISNITITDNILNLTRLSKDENGNFTAIDDDKFVNRRAEGSDIVELTTITTELKKKECVLYFAYTVTSSNKLSLVSTEAFSFISANKLDLNDGTDTGDIYYVYAYGTLAASFTDLKSAIEYADENFGMVIESSGNIMWAKITKPDLAKLSDTSELISKKYQSVEAILSDEGYTSYNLTGTSFANILYYGSKDIPVITYMENMGYVILSAYSSYQGVVDTLAFTSLTTGEITKMSYSDGVASVQASGNIFVVMMKNTD